MSADEEIRRLTDAVRLFQDDVDSRLLARGWVVTDLTVPDEVPLEFFWPPTAPVEYGGDPEPTDEAMRSRPTMYGTRITPWTRPTRITHAPEGWVVEYGEAPNLLPDQPARFAVGAELLADLERIECWPMSVAEAERLRMERVYSTTVADARDDHRFGFFPTDPYFTRMQELQALIFADRTRAPDFSMDEEPPTPRPRGDLAAQLRLVEAEAWASEVRTSRLGSTERKAL